MKYKWFLTAFAAIPFAAALLALQSCGGEGGPTGNPGGLPAPTAAFLALLSPEQRDATYIGSESCATAVCHGGATDGDTIYEHWRDTVHFDKGVGCERCHGPGSEHAADPETVGKILTFPLTASPVICGQCHGPTHDQFSMSQHSNLVVSPVANAILNPGQYGRTSRCIACHSGVVRTAINNGADLGAMTDAEIQEYCRATMGPIPHVADCVSCHDPHSKTGNLTDDGKEVQLRRKTFNTDITPVGPGSTAASFTTFDHSCAQCHNGRGTDPADAKLNSSTTRPSMHDSNQYNMLMGFGGVEGSGPVQRNTTHATIPGQCSKCHMPDSRHTFTVSYDKSCSPCHTAQDAAVRVQNEKDTIINQLYALKLRMEAWAFDTYGNDLYWDYTSNITAEGGTPPTQSGVPIQIKRSRHNYYFVIRSGDYGAHNAPYAKHLIMIGNQNMDELSAPLARPTNISVAAKFQALERDKKKASAADMTEDDH